MVTESISTNLTVPLRTFRAHTDIERVHWRFIVAMATYKPHQIPAWYSADRHDIIERASHLRDVFKEFLDYTKAIFDDTRRSAPLGAIRKIDSIEIEALEEAFADIRNILLNASDHMIEEIA